VSVDFTPKSVDVSSSSQTITVTAHVTDDNSGVSYVQPLFSSPSGQQSATAGLTLVSGTAQDGIYQGIVTIPESAESGTWTMGQFWVGDVVGNSLSYPDSAQYPTGTPTQLVVSARLETERLNVQVVHGATHSVITDANLSGGAGTQLNATGKGQYVTYAVPVQDAGTYHVRVGVQTRSNKGIFQLSINGGNQGSPVDEYLPSLSYGMADLGTVTFLNPGDQSFTFTVKGKNAASTGYTLAFDYIELIPTSRQETESLNVQSKTTGPAGVFNAPAASNGAGTYFNATGVGNYITYTVPVVKAGTYHVRVGIQTRANKGMFQLAINGLNIGQPQDEYYPSITYVQRDLGLVSFSVGGNYAFKFTVTGKNASSSGYTLAFDYIELVEQSFFPLSFSTVDPNCDGDFFIGTFTNPFDRDALLQITGTVDDDLLVDGIVIQDGEFPFTDTAPNPCPGSGVLNGIHAITYLATVSTHQTVSISVRNNFRGYASINGTLVFQ